MEATPTPQSTRRRKVTKFALAGVAVLGVGAALTSAAWSDNVFFFGQTDSADFELQGWNGTTWEDADSAADAITLPASAFDELAPGIADSYELRVRNNGDIPIYLADPIVTVGGGLDATPVTGNVETSFGLYTQTTLAPGAQARITISLEGTANLLEDTTGNVQVQIVGSSENPNP